MANLGKLKKYIVLLTILIALLLMLDFFLATGGTSIDNYVDKIKLQYLSYLPRILGAIIVFVIAKIFMDLTSGSILSFLRKLGKDSSHLLKIYRYLLWFLAGILALSILIENLSTFVMSIGLIGFGLTFALRTPISCLVAWVIIMINRPYRLNDRIKVGDKVEGDVLDITIFYTLIREMNPEGAGLTGRLITLPNNIILTTEIINYTLDVEYVWDEVSVSVTYESNRELAEKIAYECTEEVAGSIMERGASAMEIISQGKSVFGRGMSPSISKKPTVQLELDDSWFTVGVRYISLARNRRKIRTQIYQRMLDRFRETEEVEIAYPHMQIVKEEKD